MYLTKITPVAVIALFFILPIEIYCQTEGRIVFEERTDVHRRIPEERAEWKDMIPQFRSQNYELYYTEQASKYKLAPANEDEEITVTRGGGHMRMRMAPPDRELYKNLEDDKMVDEREFMTKKFLIKGVANPYQWRIGDGQKQIMDFYCMQASSQDSLNTYTVWFTPQIPVSNGPDEFGGLPGMVLQVDVNDGERVITAVSIHEEVVDRALLREPTRGKVVTQEEFREIVREKMAEMRSMQGGGRGGMFIRNQ